MSAILAALSLLVAIAGIVKLILKSRQDNAASRIQEAINAQLLQHADKLKLSITEAERRAAKAQKLVERVVTVGLDADVANRVLSGQDSENK